MAALTAVADEPQPPYPLVSEIGSERATSGGGGKIVTFDGRTHVVWQDVTGDGYFNRVRSFDHASGRWSEPFTLNRGKDNHARPVITVDRRGYLHVILSGHNSPVTYRRSLEPNDASAWSEPEEAGSGTYPIVVCGVDGTLYLTMRSPKRWNGVDLYVKRPDQPWHKQAKLVLRDPELPGYAAFHAGMAWGPKHETLHMVVDFYESEEVWKRRGVHQAVCYMQSNDGGTSWQKADGTQVKLPARPEQMDILAQSRGVRHEPIPPPVILAQGSIVADSENRPHVLYVSHLNRPGDVIHATVDEAGRWQQSSVDALPQAFPELRPIDCRGSLSRDEAGGLYSLLELVPLGDGWVEGKPSRELSFRSADKQLIWLVSHDGGKTFDVETALKRGLVFNQANAERPTGFNRIPASPLKGGLSGRNSAGRFPPFIYFDGTSRYPQQGEVLQNNVYFVESR